MENSEQNQSSLAADLQQRQERLGNIVNRISVIDSMIAETKAFYNERDQLTQEVMNLVGVNSEVTVGDTIMKVVDNFAEKNVVFRQAAVRRFELEFDSVMVRTEKLMKAALKGSKK